MDENAALISAKRKLEILQRILLIASMTEEYFGDKKMRKALSRTLKQEAKKLAFTKYPILGDDANELIDLTVRLREIIARFKKLKKAEHYRIASAALSEFMEDMNRRLEETVKFLQAKQAVQQSEGAQESEPKGETDPEEDSQDPKALRGRDSE